MRIIGNNPAEENAEITAIASGTLPSGLPVVVNADGTVSIISTTSVSQSLGSAAVFQGASINGTNVAATYDANAQKVVIAYKTGAKGTAVVGTVSGTSISFGTPAVFENANVEYVSITYDANAQKVVVVYSDAGASAVGTAAVGTVSGTNISFGTPVVFNAAASYYNAITYDAVAQKVVVAFRDAGNGNDGTAIVGTVSGTSISFGSEAVFETGTTTHISIVYDTNAQKVVIAYMDDSNGNKGTAVVATVSGTSISFGTLVIYEQGETLGVSVTYDANAQKVVIAYVDQTNSFKGTAIVGTVSGTNISFGTAVVFKDANIGYTPVSVVYNAAAQKVIISYIDTGNGYYATAAIGTLSGTDISFGTDVALNSVNSSTTIPLVYDENAKAVVLSYEDQGNGRYGTSVVFQSAFTSTNFTAENFIGMSRGPTSSITVTQAIGSTVDMQSNRGDYVCATYDSNSNKVVVAFSGDANGNAGKAIVGTVSGTSISFGTLAQFYSGRINGIGITFDSANNKVVVSYADVSNSGYGTAAVGTVSGTDISFGTPVVYNSGATGKQQAAFDPSSGKVVIAYIDDGDSSDGTAIVGTVSGTGISFGSEVDFNTGSISSPTIVADTTNDKVVVSYKDGNFGKSRVGTVSGTSISFGTEATFVSAANYQKTSCFDSDTGKVFVAYKTDGGSNSAGVVGTVSGTDITFGTPVVFSTNSTAELYCCYNTAAKKVILTYEDATDSQKLKIIEGTISGTTVSFGSAIDSGSNSQISTPGIVYDSTQEVAVVAFRDSPAVGTDAFVFRSGGTQITRAEVASGSPATIDIGSAVSVNQLSLTAGQQYFVQTDGTIGLTADDPSVIAGTAISATDIIVKG
tara:strand:- start:396 stop:2975 length:2580 start_codon:yes stop_codon:yes gene_type:complete